MSNTNTVQDSKCVYLSAEQLLQLGWHRDTSLPIRGPKDYAPTGSWLENKAHKVTCRERTELLAEERIAKLGSLARGDWKPEIKKVHLTQNKKKFWQTMGYSEDGMDFLYPEEALFLLDASMMEIYYGGVPLSVQQAYAAIMQCDLTIEQYQVFSLLSRYGYILRRHDINITDYEHQINLNQFTNTKKRKRPNHYVHKAVGEAQSSAIKVLKGDVAANNSNDKIHVIGKPSAISESDLPVETVDRTSVSKLPMETKNETTSCELNIDTNGDRTLQEDTSDIQLATENSTELHVTAEEHASVSDLRMGNQTQTPLKESTSGGTNNARGLDLHINSPEWKTTSIRVISKNTTSREAAKKVLDQDELRLTSNIPYSTWDWSNVALPDIANKCELTLTKPNADLLPNCVLYGQDMYKFDISSFVRGKPSEKGLEYSKGGTSWKCNIKATNWGEYRKQHRKYMDEYSLETSPAGHLWRGDVKPLVKPQDAISTASVLDKLQIIQSVQLSLPQLNDMSGIVREERVQIMFDVHLPNSRFKKTAHLTPHHHLCVMSARDRLPSIGESLALSRHCYLHTPLHFAVVDGGDINFYIFHDVKLPKYPDGQ